MINIDVKPGGYLILNILCDDKNPIEKSETPNINGVDMAAEILNKMFGGKMK